MGVVSSGETVDSYRFLGCTNKKADWSNSDAFLLKKTEETGLPQEVAFCSKLLQIFYQSVVVKYRSGGIRLEMAVGQEGKMCEEQWVGTAQCPGTNNSRS